MTNRQVDEQNAMRRYIRDRMGHLGWQIDQLMTPEQVQSYFSIRPAQLGKMRRSIQRPLKFVSVGYRTIRFKPEEILAYEWKYMVN